MDGIFYRLGDGTYLDSVKRVLVDKPEHVDLRKHALEAITRKPWRAHVVCIPTWSCNLRCPFCYVGKLLDKGFSDQNIDPEELYDFIERLKSRYGLSRVDVTYLGGEPLVGFRKMAELDEAAKRAGAIRSITTNLSVELTDEMVEFLSQMGQVNVSLDGDEDRHNKLRKVYRHEDNQDQPENVYAVVLENLKRLMSSGLDRSKIAVQGASSELDPERLRNLVYDLFEIGIVEEQLTIAALAPTDKFKIEDYRIPALVRNIPCCCYRYMEYFVVDGTGLYSNYFDKDQKFRLGGLGDDLEELERKYMNMIESSMPAFSDEVCMSCEVFGMCWGHCHGHIGNGKIKPSTVCSKADLVKYKDEAVANGTIIEKTRCRP